MKGLTLHEFVQIDNAVLVEHLEKLIIEMLKHGISEETMQQFFCTAVEITLRFDNGRMK